MKYTDFVKEQMKNPRLQGMKQTEKMAMIGKMWRASGHSKSSKGKGVIGDVLGEMTEGFTKSKTLGKKARELAAGRGLVGDILGEMTEGFTRSKTLGNKTKNLLGKINL